MMLFEAILKQKKVYLVMLSLALWFGCSPSPSFALPVSSYEQSTDYSKDREIIDSFLAEEAVSEKLASMGLSKDEIESRLGKLSDAQIHNLAMRLDRIKAGGDAWIIVLVVVLIFIGITLFFLSHTIHVEPRESLNK